MDQRPAIAPEWLETTSNETPSESAPLERGLERARRHLLSLQHEAGYWKGALDTNVTMDAEDLLLREFLGNREEAETAASARWIRSQQAPDGSWSNAPGAAPDVSTSVEAYLALRMAGDTDDAPHMRAAARFIRAEGGLAATRVFTRVWLALFGLWSWDELPTLPPEIMLLPPWFPLNVYDFACWARQTIVALSVVMTLRPVRLLDVDLAALTPTAAAPDARVAGAPRSLASRVFGQLDRALHAYARRPHEWLRERALFTAERWIVDRQEADGSWGGIQPPWVYSLIALSLRGYGLEHPVIERGLAGLESFTIVEGDTRRLEACQSPVWDTALAAQALADAGVPRSDPALQRAAGWLLDEQVHQAGDWSVRRPDLPPGGWAFEFDNAHYPDVDDTAEVMLALRAVEAVNPPRVESALARGVTWVLGMQSRSGGWGAFDADNEQALCRHIPFCDFGEVIDEPSADVTAHVIEMLAREGLGHHPQTQRAVRWLLEQQEPDGSWFGRWGVNHVYGTGAVLMALASVGITAGHPGVDRAVGWLHDHQNDDGGWGESVRSYDEAAWRGVGESTPSQTAWVVLGLMAACTGDAAASRGIEHLLRTQRADGGWDEALFTGTGFPGDFYIAYHLYRDVFPTMALGRAARLRGVIEESSAAGRPEVALERLIASAGEG